MSPSIWWQRAMSERSLLSHIVEKLDRAMFSELITAFSEYGNHKMKIAKQNGPLGPDFSSPVWQPYRAKCYKLDRVRKV
jgi:hypothetical protein